MSAEALLARLAGIAVAGIGAQWVAWRLKVPSILILLTVGLVAGPGLGWVGDDLLGDLFFPLVSLAVAVILFEGGLTLDLRELRQIGRALSQLVTVGVAVTWALAATSAHLVVGLPWGTALLLGAILSVTGPTVIGPLLRHMRPKGSVGPIANWEGIVVDVIGAILAVLVFRALREGATVGGGAVSSTLGGLLATGATGLVTGGVVAWAFTLALRRRWIPDPLQAPAALAAALGTYALADHWQSESGLLAVTLIGLWVRNQRRVPVGHIVAFKENLRTVLLSALFILLAARIDLAALRGVGAGGLLFVASLVLVVRPAAVFLGTLGSSLPPKERLLLAALAPRGIVAAAISALFGAQLEGVVPGAERLAPLAFLVIIATVAIYGLGAPLLARRLGLAEASPQGIVLVGGGRFSRALARALGEAGLAALLVDTNRRVVSEARLAGLHAVHGDALNREVVHSLPLGGVGRLFALTPNDEVNSLACLSLAELLGRSHCYQLVPGKRGAQRDRGSNDLRGRALFDPDASFGSLERRMARGFEVRGTSLTETFDAAAWRSHHGPDAVALLAVDGEGRAKVLTAREPPQLAVGVLLIGLVPAEEDAGEGSGSPSAEGETQQTGKGPRAPGH